jgi:FKBP-type peptidyl-prolyl cis-trans isomerase
MHKFGLFFILLFSILVTSCKSEDAERLGPENDQINAYIKNKKLAVTDSSTKGLKFIMVKANPAGATLKSGQTVKVNYVGKFIAGKKTDEEFDSGEFSFILGAGQVVEGFDKGIAKMRVGEKSILIFDSSLGYGANGVGGSIPGNTPLLFEIAVLLIN